MSVERVDVAVVGAGPAGMATAIAARRQGCSVAVLDEQPAAGGQIYREVLAAPAARAAILGADYSAGAVLAREFASSGAVHHRGASVWQVTAQRRVAFVQDGASREMQAGAVVLCTGALERPMPVPGWTLPGVMTAGAAQILLKTAGALPEGPVVLAGCGPLLYLLAVQYLRAGLRPTAIVDTGTAQQRRAAWRLLPAALRDWRLLAKGAGLLSTLRRGGIPIHHDAQDLAIEGEAHARAVRFHTASGEHRIATPLVLLHQGVVPNTQATRALRARHVWDDVQLCWRPDCDVQGALAGLPGIFVAGDGQRIMGALASAESGRLAGLAAARAAQGAEPAAPPAGALKRLAALCAARPFVDVRYRPAPAYRIPADDVVVCRCEEVTAGEIRRHVRAGCVGTNQLKAFTRCGMGPCQGRQCAATAAEVIAAERGLAPAEVELQRVRAPLKPLTLGELAAL